MSDISLNLSGRKWRDFTRAFYSNRQAMVGLCLFAFILLVAILAPVIAPYDPKALVDKPFVPPCREHFFGTDDIGRDYFSRVIYGARISLLIGVIAAGISGTLGTLVGAVAGFYGGRADDVLGEIIDVVLMVPAFFLIMVIAALFGSSAILMMVVIGLTSWPGNARVMRSQALSLRTRTFVIGARSVGVPEWRIMFKYVIPNGIFPVISNTTMQIASAILTEAGLSFLGLGDPNAISWGLMIFGGRAYVTTAWWISTFSGIAIVITVTAFYLIGDGLNKVLNPKLRS